MRYHWGLGVGHMYAHGQGASNGTQESTGEGGEHDPAAGKCNEDIYHSPDASNGDENDEDEWPDQVVDDDSQEESESESVKFTDDDIEDYDALDYQN